VEAAEVPEVPEVSPVPEVPVEAAEPVRYRWEACLRKAELVDQQEQVVVVDRQDLAEIPEDQEVVEHMH
jgi:hypothetical protein